MFVITLGDIIGIALLFLFVIVLGVVVVVEWWNGRKKK